MRNRSHLTPVLARGYLDDHVAALDVTLELHYQIGSHGELAACAAAERGEMDPPDIGRVVLWRGVSVTASGHAHGPSHPPHVRPVHLQVGDVHHRVIVFGPRVWRRGRGGLLEPSDALPFEELAVSWEHAYGGSFELAPGYLPGTDMPHPGGRIGHVLNPRGMGWYRSESDALGQPLPHVEAPAELIRAWTDTPVPAGMAPCPELPGLRMPLVEQVLREHGYSPEAPADALPPALPMMLAGQHHAPAPLVLEDVEPGTALLLEGLGGGTVQLRLPSCPIVVRARRSRTETLVTPRLRSVHIDGDARRLDLVWGHPHRYTRFEAPHWIEVTERQEAAA